MRWLSVVLVCTGCGMSPLSNPNVEWSGIVHMEGVDLHGELWVGGVGLLSVEHTMPGGTTTAMVPIHEPTKFTLHLTSELASEEQLRERLNRPVKEGEVWESYQFEQTSDASSNSTTGLRAIDPTLGSVGRIMPAGIVPFGVTTCLMERRSGSQLTGEVPLCPDDGDANRAGLSVRFDPVTDELRERYPGL